MIADPKDRAGRFDGSPGFLFLRTERHLSIVSTAFCLEQKNFCVFLQKLNLSGVFGLFIYIEEQKRPKSVNEAQARRKTDVKQT